MIITLTYGTQRRHKLRTLSSEHRQVIAIGLCEQFRKAWNFDNMSKCKIIQETAQRLHLEEITRQMQQEIQVKEIIKN